MRKDNALNEKIHILTAPETQSFTPVTLLIYTYLGMIKPLLFKRIKTKLSYRAKTAKKISLFYLKNVKSGINKEN